VGKEVSADGDGERLLKEPDAFLHEMEAKLTPELRTNLQHRFEVRGDMFKGLGANKCAALDYACALRLGADGPTIKTKKARVEEPPKELTDSKVPVTVMTGFLGSGKTTLLNRILHETHGKRIAVIENEFGEVGIDDALIETGPMTMEENIVEMSNGCICCTVRGDLIAGLKKLIKNFKKNSKPLDGVLIETTGLADPAPVAHTFFADDFVQRNLALDGILTVVDAKHLIMHLDEDKPKDDGWWNIFETALVGLSVIDVVLTLLEAGNAMNVTFVRVMRLYRFVRILRMVRVMRFFYSFRLMVHSVIHSILSLLWVFGILLFIMYFFAMLLLHGVTEHFRTYVEKTARFVRLRSALTSSACVGMRSLWSCPFSCPSAVAWIGVSFGRFSKM